ncbi:hypothetical protein EDB81DRAFT_805214 [Dactylonectria macrodidyma]|uniref:Uncharacterized protein n=1 Tax=Dactylonectria macrodidyma TaxID=307937 RepID=A0A9P9EA38_9HYPO|nr:hypothetical protein EDB81DRAFT_805214 [Dactylonectria macrodidyma]
MLGSLAASIAAGNVTILATTISSNDPLLSVLSREWAQYLDRDCNFLVPSFDLSEFDQGMVNQVVIYDGFPQSYQSILASPGSKFFNTRDGGFNIAIICEGHKSWPLITQQVQSMTDPHIPILDRLHAIFIREEDVEPFQQSMNHVLESTRTDRNSGNEHVVVLKSLLSEHVDVDLDSDLASATEQGRLLLVVVRSLERAVDALVALSSSIMQLALLGPEASKVYSFVSTWVPAKVMAIDFIYPIAITRESTEPTSAVVSPHTFSRQMFKASRRTQQLPDDTPSIRATYEGLVVPLKPEPRGERIGFFTQVEYLVKSVGATLGLITIGGIYYGIRRFR